MATIVPSTVAPTIGTPTHNTSGYDEVILISGTNTSASVKFINALCDSSATPTTQVATMPLRPISVGGTVYATVCFVVPNGYYWTISGTLETIASGWIWQIQSGVVNVRNVTSSRALATQYRNTTGNAILLLPQIGSMSTTLAIAHDPTTSPTTNVWNQTSQTTQTYTPWAIIPNNDYYKVTSSGASVVKWLEIQFPFQATRVDKTGSRAVNTIYQNTTTESLWEVLMTQNNGGPLGSRWRHVLWNDTATPPVKMETVFSDTAGNELETMPGFVGVNYYFEETSPDGTSDTLLKWWEYSFVNSALNGTPIVQFALP